MEQRTAGSSSLSVSLVGMGTWQFGSKGAGDYWGVEFTQDMATDFVTRAVADGVTYFDTAEDYAGGNSELQLGRAIASLDAETRARVVVGSKIKPNSCFDVESAVEGSLTRLGLPAIDLYMVHWPLHPNSMGHFAGKKKNAEGGRDYADVDAEAADNVPDVTKTFEALQRLQAAGKIRHIGTSNFGVKDLEAALATGAKIAMNQVCYNLIFRAAELEVIPFCRQHGIGVLAYSPLMQALLTGRWKNGDELPPARARTRHFSGTRPVSRHGEAGHEKLLFDTIANIRAIAEEETASAGGSPVTMADLAFAWLAAQEGVTGIIAGATKYDQLERSIKGALRKASDETIAKLTAATDALKEAMGPNIDLWQGGDNSRCH